MKKKVVFISLPMSGLSDELIASNIEAAKADYLTATKLDISQVAFVSNLGCPPPTEEKMVKKDGLWYLGEAIKLLSECDEALFWHGWRKARGCIIEFEACGLYGIPTITIDLESNKE